MLTPGLVIAISLARADWTDEEPLTATPAQLLDAAHKSDPPKDYDVDVLVDEERYTVDDQGRVTIESWLVYEITAQSAIDSWGAVNDSWSPWHEDRAEIRARVIDSDGREWKLDPRTLVEGAGTGNNSYSFDDVHTLKGPLPGIRVGSVVEEVHTVHENRPFVGQYGSGVTRLDRRGPDDSLRLVRVQVPASVPLNWQLLGPDDSRLKVQERHTRGETIVEISTKGMPELEDWQAKVPLTDLQGHYVQFSTAPSWNAIVSAYADQIEPLIDPTGLDEVLAAAKAGKDDDERIRLAVRAVQDRMRYAAIPFGEHAIVPYTPALAISRAYGDCKDQAVAVTATLRALGFDAHVALLWSGAALDMPGDVPRLDRFNHAIVVVKRPNGDMWIDPTVRGTPVGELPFDDQNHIALIVDKATTAPVLTPRGAAFTRTTVDVDLRRAGPAKIRTEVRGSGWVMGYYRDQLANLDPVARDAWAERSYGTDDDDPHEVTSDFPAVSGDDREFAFSVAYVRPTSAYTGITDASLRVSALDLLAELSIPTAEVAAKLGSVTSSTTVRLNPERSDTLWHIQLPPGVSWDVPLTDDAVDVGPVHVSRTFSHDDKNVWTLKYTLDVTADHMSLAELGTLTEALAVGTYTNSVALIAHADASRQVDEGHAFEGLRHAREVLDANPDAQLAHAQLVAALADAGFGDAARAEAALMNARTPDTVESVRAELIATVKDARGQFMEGDWQRRRALDALDKLATLESSAKPLTSLRVRLLLSPPDTLTPPDAADVALARTLVDDAIKEDGETAEMGSWRLNIRYLSGELDVIAATPCDKAWTAEAAGDWLAAVLLKRGLPALISARQAIDENSRSVASQRAVDDLERARRPDLGLAVLTADGKGAFAKVVASRPTVKPWETEVADDGPHAPFLATLALAMDAPGAKAAWSRHQAPSMAQDEGDYAESLRGLKQMGPLISLAFLDVFAVELDPLVMDHDIARATLGDFQSGAQHAMYASVDGSKVRMIGEWSTGGAVARKALERLDHHDVVGAERLLTWINEDAETANSDSGPSLARALHTVWPPPPGADKEAAMRRALLIASLFAPGGSSAVLDAARQDPTSWPSSTVGAVAVAACTANRWPATAELARYALANGNTDRPVTRCLVSALNDTHDVEGAATVARTWLTQHPDDALMLAHLASALYAGGHKAEAVDAARTASRDPNTANSSAWTLMLADENDAALKVITPAGTDSKSSSAVRHTYAVALVLTHHMEEAQAQWDRARDAKDMGDEWWYVAGGIAEALGLRDQAILDYRRVSRDDAPISTWQFAARALTRLGEKP